MYASHKKGTYPSFRQRLMRIKTNCTLQCWYSLASDISTKSRLNLETDNK